MTFIHSKSFLQRILRFFVSFNLAVFLFSGCTNSANESGKTKIAGIVFQEDQFFRMIELGMKEAAKENNVEILIGNSSGAPDREVSLIDSYIAGNVDAIVISPLSAKASQPALKRAAEKGVKIVTYNTTLESDLPDSYIESDQFNLGALTGQEAKNYVEQNLNGKAKIALIEFMSQAPEQAALRVNGFKSEIKKLPGVEIVAEQDAWLVQQAADVVERIIIAHPDINLIWAANEGGTVGAAIGVKNAGKADQIKVFGTDMSEQLADFILSDDNILQATTGQKPFEIGKMAVENALRILSGETVNKKISLSGILFSRSNTSAINDYKSRLEELLK